MNKELSPNSTLSHYRIVSKIGAGGMGEVYLAEDTKLDRQVALKILPKEFAEDNDRMNRFVREAKSASALNQPNIITIHEIGETNGTHFITSEYIQGETLHELLQQRSLDLKTTLDVAIQVASALNAAHKAGIIHRDIKPENVMIRPDGLVKILDFGIAKLSEERRGDGETRGRGEDQETRIAVSPRLPISASPKTDPGMIIGTANYMSPEQARGKEVSAQSDIFSFGIVLYEMVTGQRAFKGENALDVIGAILHKEPTPLRQLSPELPNEIERIINKTLRKGPDARYQTAGDLLTDLKDAKQELEFKDKLERSVAPQSQEQKTQTIIPQSTDAPREVQSSTSSLEYAVTQAKSHKLAAGLVALVLLGVLTTAGYFAFVSKAGSTKQISSIAVMPFVNESQNADVEYLSDGMTETLIKSLSNLSNLDVKPRSAVFRYKGKDTDLQTIAKELNVQAILNGRVAQRGDQLTLSLELVDAQKNSVIWTEQYQRKQSDLVSLQSEIAKDVSTKLKAKLSGAEETKVVKSATADPEAYQAYLKGRYYWNRRTAENIKKAIEQFKSATDRDPNYALAFVGLADCYGVLNEYAGTPSSETLPQSRSYAERALTIDGQLAEAHATLGLINDGSWQWGDAEKEFKRAIELSPKYPTAYHWYSVLLKDVGRNDEAAAMIKRAQELDPLSSVIAVNVSRMYQLQNNHEASIENSLKLIELDPNFAPAYEYLALSYLKRGRNAEAIAAAEKAVDLSNRSGISLGDLGYVYALVGKRAEAIEKIKELEEKYTRKEAIGQYLAAVYVGLGDKDKAFEWLEKDFQARNGKLVEIRWQLQFEPLYDDPRYKDLLKRMGLPE
jgi:serine/threonine protein kinase/Flp pilus assembly protein TadD